MSMTVFHKLRVWINRQLGLYHWYEVRYIYVNKRTTGRILDWATQIGVTDMVTILDSRSIKKIQEPLHKKPHLKKYLQNGRFDVEIICYLGLFPRRPTKPKNEI